MERRYKLMSQLGVRNLRLQPEGHRRAQGGQADPQLCL
jgi:DNA segregation ATPase FtsK/SpoIIIE-like protein